MNLIYNPKETELIDCDDVIRDWNPFLNQIWNRENQNNQKPLPMAWDLKKHYGPEIAEFYQVKHAEEIYTRAPVIDGALHFLHKLRKIRQIYLVSSQPTKQIEEYTKYWIIDKQIPFDYYKFTHDKGSVKGDHLFDDGIHNLESALNSKNSIPVCFNQPWNQDWKGLRVYSHQEFLDIVKNHHSI